MTHYEKPDFLKSPVETVAGKLAATTAADRRE